jgi:hypothetical protein
MPFYGSAIDQVNHHGQVPMVKDAQGGTLNVVQLPFTI